MRKPYKSHSVRFRPRVEYRSTGDIDSKRIRWRTQNFQQVQPLPSCSFVRSREVTNGRHGVMQAQKLGTGEVLFSKSEQRAACTLE